MRLWAATLVASVLLSGCNKDKRVARNHLEGEGLENIEMVAQAKHGEFRYTATRDDDRCVGAIEVQRGRGTTQINDRISCRPLESQCTAEAPGICFRLGQIHDSGDDGPLDPTPRDKTKAAQWYRAGCDYGDGPCCNQLGVLHAEGEGVAKDMATALALFKQACDGGAGRGCLNLGISYHHGRGVKADSKRAAELYQAGCRLKSTSACYNLGVCTRDGIGVERDPRAAVPFFAAACSKRHYEACVNLGLLYLDDDVGRNEARARHAFAQACKGGLDDACQGLRDLEIQ